jgi:hypothetical protein
MKPTELDFIVAGSTGNKYTVSFLINNSTINAHCTCEAGKRRNICRHREDILAIALSSKHKSASANHQALKKLIEGTALESAYTAYHDAKVAQECANSQLAKAKDALKSAMYA